MESKNTPLGPVLVTGGCGFLGYHLVAQLLADPSFGPVYVLDLTTTRNTHPGATYLRGSVADPAPALAALLDRLRPVLVLHAASPSATYAARAAFAAANVDGTAALLRVARESPHVRALVHTSSVDVYAHPPPHRHVREDAHPLWPDRPPPWRGVSEYDRTKAVAHRLVLAANDPAGGLRTAVIVPAHMWGLRNSQALSLFFDTFADSRAPQWQVGPGTNKMSVVEVGNCAAAHLLAAKHLLASSPSPSPSNKVDGEAFNVTDGTDVNFWEDTRAYCRLIQRAARGPQQQQQQHQQQPPPLEEPPPASSSSSPKTYVIPTWVMALVVVATRWLYLVFTLGRAEPPPALGRNSLSWCTEDHTLDDAKARERLGYRPRVVDVERLRAEAVEWERERRSRLAAGKKDA